MSSSSSSSEAQSLQTSAAEAEALRQDGRRPQMERTHSLAIPTPKNASSSSTFAASPDDTRLSHSLPSSSASPITRVRSQERGSLSPSPDSIRTRHKSVLLRDVSRDSEDSADNAHVRRRAVSDAAQWLRKERQRRLHKELLLATDKEATPHRFQEITSTRSGFCAVCSKSLWAIRGALGCTECGIETHRSCATSAQSCLGRAGSVASEQNLLLGPPLSVAGHRRRKINLVVDCADGLARKNLFRLPDPFAICTVDDYTFQTAIARKSLSPVWKKSEDIYASAATRISIHVFDAKRYRPSEWHGFLGMAIVPAAAFLDDCPLGEGATKVLRFRLRKRLFDDVVTGTVTLRASIYGTAAQPPNDVPPSPQHELMVSTSQGEGWQRPLQKALTASKASSQLLPPRPGPPRVRHSRSDNDAINVYWGEQGSSKENTEDDGIISTLAVLVDDDPTPQDVYHGSRTKYKAVGFRPGQALRFVVKLTNFFGSSDFSEPSAPIEAPKSSEPSDERSHCPMFMAGFCYRGSNCPLYHGSGARTDDDIAATLAVAAFAEDPDVQMAVAIQASLLDAQRNQVDAKRLPQFARDFHRREAKFRVKLPKPSGECRLCVSRGDLFKTSFIEVNRLPAQDLRKRLIVTFNGEGGLDYGGLAREWFYLLSLEMFDPELGMFAYCSDEDYALQINPDCAADQDHLLYFHFVGRVIGMAVFHRHFLDVSFTPAFYKQLLGKPVTLSDLQDVDPALHRSLIWIMENDVSEVPEMSFTVDYHHFGEIKTHELKPDGASIAVTEDNKEEFLQLMLAWHLTRGREQMRALIHGFYEIIPPNTLGSFTEKQLELLISGLRAYDLDDWKANTLYSGYTENSQAVKWFWEIIESFTLNEQADLMQFCTGSSRVPVEGFQALQGSDGPRKFNIARVEELDKLPAAHTCFNKLDLPDYPSKQMMRERLVMSMHGAQGFAGD